MVEWWFFTHFFLLAAAVMGWVAAYKEYEEKMEWKEKHAKLQKRQMNEVKKAILAGAGNEVMSALLNAVGFGDGDMEEIDLSEDDNE